MDSGARSCFILICSDGETEIKAMIISRARQKQMIFVLLYYVYVDEVFLG